MRRVWFFKPYLDVYEHTYPGTVSALLMEHNVNIHLDISVLQQIVFNRESLEIMAYV